MRANVYTLLAILLCTSAPARAFAAASLTPLGGLGGGAIYSQALGVSGDGSVVVGYSWNGSADQAFRWTRDGGMMGLGTLPGHLVSNARGVNGDGSVIVGYSSPIGPGSQAFRWTSNGGMVGLGWGGAMGVSADGSVIVGSYPAPLFIQAFRWTAMGGMQGLGDPPGEDFNSHATGVSGDGSVVVGYTSTANRHEAFRWTSDGGMVGLGILPSSNSSQAWGVSADGSVIVGTSGQAFRWTSDGGMVGLGIPGYAWGVSADGSIVVGEGMGGAFYWTADGGVQTLWDLLLSHGVNPAADAWTTLASAQAISTDGNTIVGRGTRNGTTEAFIAVVPEPATGALALLGVSRVLLLRRRSRARTNEVHLGPGGSRARRRIMRSNLYTFSAILLCTSAATRAFAAATLTPLGFLPGGFDSEAFDVSADGSVIVGWSRGEAFRWTSAGDMVGLGGLGGASQAYGVSADGSVIIGASGSEAFRWTAAGGMQGLGDLPGGLFSSWGWGVSADGSVIVGTGSSAGNQDEGFRWTAASGMVGLGYLPGFPHSAALAISADGSTIVGLSGFQACRWTSDAGMVGLGNLPGGAWGEAHAVSADGSVIVGHSYFPSGYEAFRWTSDGGMVGLGIPSHAWGVSADGSIVVGEGMGGAFYWTADGGVQTLWDLLLSHGVNPAADGWSALASAQAISADGNTIVGFGLRNGNFFREAFVAVIPEPATGALALLGVSSIPLLRRRSDGRSN